MTITQCIEKVTNWLNESVCPKIKLKLPDDNQNGKGYKVETVNPTAFAMYQPGKDKLPPGVIAPFPSVVVQLLEGSDNMIASNGRMKLQLSFTAWNPGKHAGELTRAIRTTNESSDSSDQTFTRDAEGWKRLELRGSCPSRNRERRIHERPQSREGAPHHLRAIPTGRTDL